MTLGSTKTDPTKYKSSTIKNSEFKNNYKDSYKTTIPYSIAKQIDKIHQETKKPKSWILQEQSFEVPEECKAKIKRCFSLPIEYLDKLQQRKDETGKNINLFLLESTPETIDKNLGHTGKTKQEEKQQEFDSEIDRIIHETPYQGPHSMKKNIEAMIKYLKEPRKISPLAIKKAIRNQLEVTDKRTITNYMEEIIQKLQDTHGYRIAKEITDKEIKKKLSVDFL